VVIGERAITVSLQDVDPEQIYDEDSVASYDVSTISELLDEIRSENGDDNPSILVNGQPVKDLSDIADLPIEAIRRIEQLPRGAAQRIGGSSNQRAYNVVLKPSVRSATGTASHEFATEGGWNQEKGEALLTYVRDSDRLNLTLRHTDSSLLLESERRVTPRTETIPFSILGNVIPRNSNEVDPVLSALLGRPVTVVALTDNSHPTINDLLARANTTNPSDAPGFRSLRGASTRWEAALAGNKQLTEWLSVSANGRLTWNDSDSFRGLPGARSLVPATNQFTPFSNQVFIALSDPTRPLRSGSEGSDKSLSTTLNANFGQWHATLLGRYADAHATYTNDLVGSITGGFAIVDDTTNPFAGSIAMLIPVSSRESTSRTIDRQLVADADGPLFTLPAGPVLARLGAGTTWTSFKAVDASGNRTGFDRHEVLIKGGVTIPITGGTLLPALGSSEFAFDVGRLDIGRYGTINRRTIALNWSPVDWLKISASESRDGSAIYPGLVGAPVVITENVPYFDPVRNETVDVRLVTGGAPGLDNPRRRTRALSLAATPWAKYNVQLNIDYQKALQRNLIGSLPPPSTAIVNAFADRFVRDSSGRLIRVNTTSVNFDRQDTEEVRFGASFRVPLSSAVSVAQGPDRSVRRIPPTVLQVNLAHTLVLDSTTVIRPGLPEIDLLAGGAVGIGGGQLRNYTSGAFALARGATGVRVNMTYRGSSFVRTGTLAAPDRLTYGPLLQMDLRVFADLAQLFPNEGAARGARISLNFDNLLNDREKVKNLAGLTPQAYQPSYLDPIGRTMALELRKVF